LEKDNVFAVVVRNRNAPMGVRHPLVVVHNHAILNAALAEQGHRNHGDWKIVAVAMDMGPLGFFLIKWNKCIHRGTS
jgi:hypothetical protein